jgi:hypothetical protein
VAAGVTCGSPAPGARGGGLRGLIATSASLLQGECPAFCRSPAPGAKKIGVRSPFFVRVFDAIYFYKKCESEFVNEIYVSNKFIEIYINKFKTKFTSNET